MEFQIGQSDLFKMVSRAIPALDKKPTTVVTGALKVEIEDSTLIIQATGAISSITLSHDLTELATDGMFIINSQTLVTGIRRLSGNLRITHGEGELVINSDSGVYKLSTLSELKSEDYPVHELEEGDDLVTIELPKTFVRDLKVSTSYCSTDPTKTALQGVNLIIKEPEADQEDEIVSKNYKLLATDGFGAVRISNGIEPEDTIDFSAILPAETAHILVKEDQGNGFNLSYKASERIVQIDLDGGFIVSRLINEEFPILDRLYPADSDTKFVVDLAQLKAAVSRAEDYAAVVSKGTGKVLKVLVTSSSLELNGETNLSSCSEKVPISDVAGLENTVEFALSSSLISRMISCGAKTAEVFFLEKDRPVKVRVPGEEHILMPIAIGKQ